MLQNILGDWGRDLSEADYACAVAALGTLESTGTKQHQPHSDVATLVRALEAEFQRGERTPIWRNARQANSGTSPDDWRGTHFHQPDLLAAAWRQYREVNREARQQPRLALDSGWRTRSDLFDFDELYDWLRHPAVGLGALVLHDRQAFDHRLTWHWPLRVGVPVGNDHDEVTSALREAQSRGAWIKELSDVVEVGAGRDRCDLLILTGSAVRDILDRPRTRLRASFVVHMGEQPASLAAATDVLSTLGRRLQASGLAGVGDLNERGSLGDWFIGVLRELSHDAPIHTAIYLQRPVDPEPAPVVVGNARALDQCRLLGLAEQQDRVATALAASQPRRPTPRPGSEPVFGGPEKPRGPSILDGLQQRLADALRLRAFDSESVDGIDTAREIDDRQGKLDRSREARWIQARAWRDESLQQLSDVVAPDRWNLVAVHIGPTRAKRKDQPFPDSQIRFEGKEVPVDVQLEVTGSAIAPVNPGHDVRLTAGSLTDADKDRLQRELRGLTTPPVDDDDDSRIGLATCRLLLPPVGDSSLALFAIHPHNNASKVDMRIAVVHANRILQTARAQVKVGDSAAGDAATSLDVISEQAIHARDDDLDERREYDVAIQVSDMGGKLHLTVQRNGTATPVHLDDLGEPIRKIQDALHRVAIQWDYAKPMLEQEAFSDVLYALAAHGTSLKQHLHERCGDEIDDWERIHLVPKTQAFLPLEYVYDGPPPASDATVCNNVVSALKNGGCEFAVEAQGKRSPCPNRSNRAHICPLRFWGFHRLIERNGVVPDTAQSTPDNTAVSTICVPSKQAFGAVRGMVFAASDKSFKYKTEPADRARERAALVASLGALTDTLADAADWDAWRKAIETNPNLLVMVAHTDQHRGAPVLEIGEKKLLGRHEILPDVAGSSDEPRVLLLLGCSAAGVTEDFQPYPERFRAQGVSIVLAPVAPIRGADAVPIAKRLAALLDERLSGPQPTAFGELLPLLRRQLLSEGHPGVMGILGFGDGDWLIGGQ